VTNHPHPLVDHIRLTVLTELAVLVHEAFPDGENSDHHYGCEHLLELVQARRRALVEGALPLDADEAARVEP
jgi:hypothetical protein